MTPAIRYVALGDSYTIGTAVAEAERWPNRLVEWLRERGVGVDLVANLAVDGSTSADAIARQLPALGGLEPGFVSLLVGVNDVVQGVAVERFESNVAAIVGNLQGRLPADRIVLIATPDYTITPEGPRYGDPERRRAGIVAVNAVLERLAAERGIEYVDIFDISGAAGTDGSLVAPDGLHPSGEQYRRWVERIGPAVGRRLSGGVATSAYADSGGS